MEKRKNSGVFPDRWFWLTLLIPVVVLFSLTIRPLSAMLAGEHITLETVPVDPKDLFYGDYVQLELAIEEVDASLLEPPLAQKVVEDPVYSGFPVYVSLRPKGQKFKAVKVTESAPSQSPYLKGMLRPNTAYVNAAGKQVYRIDYQLDRYYVEEGTGKKLEELAREGKIWVDVKVKGGYGVIVAVKPAP